MRRRGAKTDRNQAEIVSALRKVGASVQSLAEIGNGCPDLLVSFGGKNLLMEVKDWNLPPSGKSLTPDQRKWHTLWQGQVAVVETIEQALELLKRA